MASAKQVYSFISLRISFEQEEFWVLALNSSLEIIDAKCLFRGTVDHCLIHPRDIFRYGFKMNSSRLILCHSHPSGQSQPSKEDLDITAEIIAASKILKLPIEDHLIAAKRNYFSFRENGLI